MSNQKNFNFRGHSLGTVTIKLDKKGISLCIANPLIIWCRRSESNRHGAEAPRDFESENRVFANPLILKTVSLNHLKILGRNLSNPIHSTLSIPVYPGRFYHIFITLAIHNWHS